MRRIKNVRDKLQLQKERVIERLLEKIRPKQGREITNAEIQIMLYQYPKTIGERNEYGEEMMEWVADAISKLTPEQVKLYELKFVQRKNPSEIGRILGCSHVTAGKKINKLIDEIRKANR